MAKVTVPLPFSHGIGVSQFHDLPETIRKRNEKRRKQAAWKGQSKEQEKNPELKEAPQPARKRGRPKGSKNRKTIEKEALQAASGIVPAMNDAAITEKTIHTICEKTGADSDWMLDLENEDSQPGFIADNMEKATDHGLCDPGQAVVQTPADRVRELRAGLRMSQVEFANYVGVSSGKIAAIETGRSRLTEQMAAKIEDRCEHGGAEWLLTGNTRNRDYPVSTEMIEWLKSNSKIRRDIWRMMQDEKDDA